MRNIRYANAERTMVQFERDRQMPDGSTQVDTLNVPVDPSNAHFREIVAPFLDRGGTIADFVPDPAADAAARKAKVAARLLDALADDANAGKTLDQIRAEAKANI